MLIADDFDFQISSFMENNNVARSTSFHQQHILPDDLPPLLKKIKTRPVSGFDNVSNFFQLKFISTTYVHRTSVQSTDTLLLLLLFVVD